MVLPISPKGWTFTVANNIETLNIHDVGDVFVSGKSKRASFPVETFFPHDNNDYSFAKNSKAQNWYLDLINRWILDSVLIRFIVGGTSLNVPVKIESHEYGEPDGTNDIHGVLTLKEHITLLAPQYKKTANEKGRMSALSPDAQTHMVVKGDTLSALCWKHYGKATPDVWNKVAKHNNISNPHLIYPGQGIHFPQPLT